MSFSERSLDMLGKILKYDLRAAYKLWLLFTAIMFGICFVGAFALRSLVTMEEFSVFSLFAIGGVMLSVFAMSCYVMASQLLVLYRYYQNFFTDEAYLTFTLPIKRSTQLNSKLLCGFIFTSVNIVAVALAAMLFISITPVSNTDSTLIIFEVFAGIFDAFTSILKLFNGWAYVYTILGILIYLAASVFSTVLIYACITLGCTMVRKYKLLMAILVYYLVNMAISTLSYIASIILGLTTISGASVLAEYSDAQMTAIVLFAMIAVLAFFIALTVLTYKFTLSRIENKLNLA